MPTRPKTPSPRSAQNGLDSATNGAQLALGIKIRGRPAAISSPMSEHPARWPLKKRTLYPETPRGRGRFASIKVRLGNFPQALLY